MIIKIFFQPLQCPRISFVSVLRWCKINIDTMIGRPMIVWNHHTSVGNIIYSYFMTITLCIIRVSNNKLKMESSWKKKTIWQPHNKPYVGPGPGLYVTPLDKWWKTTFLKHDCFWNFRSHCECDKKFQQCLNKVNTPTAHTLGVIFFNIVKVMCFQEECLFG